MHRLIRIYVIGLTGALLFAGSVRADDWPCYQHDAGHSGNSSAMVDPRALSLVWSAPSFPTAYSTPLIVGDRIYAMQNQGGYTDLQTTVSSFDLSTGAIIWSYTGNFSFPSQAAVGGGFVAFVGTTEAGSFLYVLDAMSGTVRYTLPAPEGESALMPTIIEDPTSGKVTAFVASGGDVTAFWLGPFSGLVLWTQYGNFGGASMPTAVGSSIVLAGAGDYYAFDQTTGAPNHFWSGGIDATGGTTVAYDAVRQQFYVLEFYAYTDQFMTLSAYHYTDNDHIDLLWQRTGEGIGVNESVAIGPNGNVYSAGNTVIWELDPATGATLRTIPGAFATGVTPALTNNVLWIIANGYVYSYDLSSLQFLRAFERHLGPHTPYNGPGAFTDGYFVLDYGPNGSQGFDVYRAPTPTPSPTPTPTPCTGRCEPTPRPRPTPKPRP